MNLKPGSKCFAKVKGYSPWPARIDVLPKDVRIPRGKFPIFFYGTHEVSYVTAKDIYEFEKFRPVYGLYKEKNPKFNDGISEIDNNPTIYQLGIDKRAVDFLSQFYKFDRGKVTKSILSSSSSSSSSKAATIVEDTKLKIDEIKPPQDEEIFKKSENLEVSIILKDVFTDIPSLRRFPESGEMIFRDPENTELSESPQVPELPKTEELNTVSNSFKSPTKSSHHNNRPKRASAIKFKQNLISYLKNMSSNPNNTPRKSDVLSRIKKEKDKMRKVERKSAVIVEDKNLIKKNEAEIYCEEIIIQPVLNNVTSSVDMKDEINLRTVSKLSIIDKEIKRSLIVGQENHEKCRMMMNSMLELDNLTLVLLCRVPEIIVTIRKCRRYKKDDSIKSSASKIFLDFYRIYEQSELDEKIEAGTELLKRDTTTCKSAQILLDELFGVEKSSQPPSATTMKQKMPNRVLSSPSSVHSFHSSANNTPLLSNNDISNDTPDILIGGCTLDPDMININELMKTGILELIESYSFEDANDGGRHRRKSSSKEMRPLIDDVELYKQLGV